MKDPYLQDDGITLKNKLGIVHDPVLLARAERRLTAARLRQLESNGLPAGDGFEIVKATHRHIFQDVYDWAGELRMCPLGKAEYPGLPPHYFTPPAQLEAEGRRLFADLAAEDHLKGLSRDDIAPKLAGYFARQNDHHYFREGNGRTQRLVWQHVARAAGHDLNFEGISQERMIVASIRASKGDTSTLTRMFAELLDPPRARALREAASFFDQNRSEDFDWHLRYVATTTPGQRYDGTFFQRNKTHFIMHDGQRLFIGDVRDLPGDGHELEAGAKLRVLARDHGESVPVAGPAPDTPTARPPAFEEAIPMGEYTGRITAVDADRVLQDVGDGRVLSHRRASKRQGDDALLRPGRIARIRYSARSWDVSDPNVQGLGGGRKGRGLS
jgi:cell filamentation protein